MSAPDSHTLASPLLRAELLERGAALKSLKLLRAGQPPLDLIWDLGSVAAYQANPASAGVVVGRVAGRLAGGILHLDGQPHCLSQNEGATTLHGGVGGFGWRDWTAATMPEGGLCFSLISADGDQGFPGHLEVRARYTLPAAHVLRLDLWAKSRARTAVNLTHHPYWRAGALTVQGNQAQRVDADLLPVGGYAPFPPAEAADAFDHCVKISGQGFRNIAKIRAKDWHLEVWSDACHAQIYTGQAGYICIEPQGPNAAPDVVSAGQVWRRSIEYRFGGF